MIRIRPEISPSRKTQNQISIAISNVNKDMWKQYVNLYIVAVTCFIQIFHPTMINYESAGSWSLANWNYRFDQRFKTTGQ